MATVRETVRGTRVLLNGARAWTMAAPRRYATATPPPGSSSTSSSESSNAQPKSSPASPAAPQAPANNSVLNNLESESSLATSLDERYTKKVRRFNPRGRAMARKFELPGTRYQYHPPKYYRGPLHPVQVPPKSDPTSRQFVPGPFNFPRLKHTYESMITHDILTLAYTHYPPGTKPPVQYHKYEDRVSGWDGASPYHAGRGHKAPRGRSQLPLLEHDISFNNIPKITEVSVQMYQPKMHKDRKFWLVAWTICKAITGMSPRNIRVKDPVPGWGIQKNNLAGVKATIKGNGAWEFVDKLIHIVLPRIKEFTGLRWLGGDGAGNLNLGLVPKNMREFPEVLVNYDMYPPNLIPGCHIAIKTTAQTDRQAKLLFQALGMPFRPGKRGDDVPRRKRW